MSERKKEALGLARELVRGTKYDKKIDRRYKTGAVKKKYALVVKTLEAE